MEIFEKEEEKEKYRSTKILLIINLIIWGIILFMAILWNGVVNAATTTIGLNTINSVDGSGTSTNWGNSSSSHTLQSNAQRFEYVFGNVNAGYYEGHITIELTYTGRYDINKTDIGIECRGSSNAVTCANNISWEKSVSSFISTYKISIWFNGNLTEQEWFQVRVKFPSGNYVPTGTAFKGTGSIDWTESDAATNTTINNAVTQIIQNAVENTTNVSQQIIQSNTDLSSAIANIMNNATTSIQNSIIANQNANNTTCIIKEYDNTILKQSGYLKENGAIDTTASEYYHTSIYIPIENGKTYKIINNYSGWNASYCIYDSSKNIISCTKYQTTNEFTIIPNQNGFIRYSLRINGEQYTTIFQYEKCMTNTEATMENQNQNTADIIAAIGGLEGYHTQYTPDTSDFDDLEDAENTLHQYTNINLNSFNVDLDTDTNNWVWTTLTSLLNTSSLVFGMVISILSIGLIKLILNR